MLALAKIQAIYVLAQCQLNAITRVPNWSWLTAGWLRSQAKQVLQTSHKNMPLHGAVDFKSKLKCFSFALHGSPSSTALRVYPRLR